MQQQKQYQHEQHQPHQSSHQQHGVPPVRPHVRGAAPQSTGGAKLMENFLIYLSMCCACICFPCCFWLIIQMVADYQRIVIFRNGRMRPGCPRGPGIVFVLLGIDEFMVVDLRTVSYDVPPQEVLTKDSVTVAVDAVVFYRVMDPLKAVLNVENYAMSTQLLAATTLRNVLGTRKLSELLSEREAISHTMQENLDAHTDAWGIFVERVEIKDVRLPIDLQRAMAQVAEADRQARAKIVAAEGEVEASKSLIAASQIMQQNPVALQLRYLQSLNTIESTKTTIIFPFPLEFMSMFQHQQRSTQTHPSPSTRTPPAPPTPPPSAEKKRSVRCECPKKRNNQPQL